MDIMPEIGFGLWKIDRDHCAKAVQDAIQAGFRHLDSACDYGNEREAGEGIARAVSAPLCSRDDLWITSKLWNTYHRAEHVRPACERSLRDLGLDYLDLYLIHFPIALEYVPFEIRYPPEWVFDPDAEHPKMNPVAVPLSETWGAMEDLVEAGLVKEIGVCNYNSGLLHDLMAYARIKPSTLQIESHPYLTQEKLLRLADHYGIKVTAFSPLGALSYVPIDMAEEKENVLEAPEVLEISKAHNKTPAQVVLRWGVQRGTAVVTKTTDANHMKENLAIADFALTESDMNAITGLNKNRRFNDPGVFCEAAFNTFFPIYD